MMNGKVRAFNGDMGMAMSVFKDMVGKVRHGEIPAIGHDVQDRQAKISHPSQPEAGGVTKILDTNIHESGRCGNGSGSRERNDRDSGLRGGKGLPACGDRPSIL